MSVTQNLSYAVIQVAHNFGAVATVGGSLAAVVLRGVDTRKRLARIVLAGWAMQVLSGAAFGAVSYYFYQQFPDIAGLAVIALEVKIACAAGGGLLLLIYLFSFTYVNVVTMNQVWIASSVLAVTALSAAAFLRWLS